MTRAGQVAALGRPVARTVPWLALVGAAVVAVAVVRLGEAQTLHVRLSALALCIGGAFLLDDPAAETLESVPASLLFRRLLRLSLALPVLAAAWALVVGSADVDRATWGLTLEACALLAVTLAVAARAGGVAAGPTLLALFGLAALLPSRWALLVSGPEDPRWMAAHARWALVLAAGLAAFAWASLDPGRRRPL